MTPKFSISVLGLDGIEMTKKCVGSILASNRQDFQLVLTNNASTDGTAEYFDSIKAMMPDRVTVIHHKENLGFIPTNNLAFDIARKAGCTYAVLVNNDLTVPPEWLDCFDEILTANPNGALSGPRGTISNVDSQMVGNSADKYTYCEGSCLCVKISALAPDETLFANYLQFIYFDDLELALRMQRQGRTIHQANFRVIHRNGSTCTRHPDAIQKCRDAMRHNQAVMLNRWAHWNKVRRFDFPILFRRTFATGDALLLTPIIRAMHKLWPLCPIDVETNSPDVFLGNPLVRKAAKRISIHPHTWVIDLNMSYERKPRQHVLEAYARVAGLDPETIEPKCDLYFPKLDNLDQSRGPWCAVHVGPTTWPGRNWPFDRWKEAIKRIRETGWQVLLFGDKTNENFGVDLDKRGQSGVQELAGLIAQCQLYVGLDSFPMHVAQATGVPVIALFGINNPRCFLTGGSEAIAITSDPKHPDTGRRNRIGSITFLRTDDSVMRTITVDQVMDAVAQFTGVRI